MMNQLRTAVLATLPPALSLIWLPTRIEPVDRPVAATPCPRLKMIALPSIRMPRAAVITMPLPAFAVKELPETTVPEYVPGPICRPMPLPVLVTFVIRDPVDPPRNRSPAPLNPVMLRAFAPLAAENKTLLTLAPTTNPLVPAGVPAPSSVTAPVTARPAARATVMPVSGAMPPTSPANETLPPAESRSLLEPSTVEENRMAPPALSKGSPASVTAPANVCAPRGVVTPADNRMPFLVA